MAIRSQIWTLTFVTALSVLIWVLAANATREQKSIETNITFEAIGEGRWQLTPTTFDWRRRPATLTVEGSAPVVKTAETLLRQQPLILPLPAVEGMSVIDLTEQLRNSPEIAATRVAIVTTDPVRLEVEMDEIRGYPAAIRAVLTGVQTEGEITITPATATAWIPSRLRERLPEDLVAEAFIEPSVLERLKPGTRHDLGGILRLPGLTASESESVTFEPESARVTFAIRSQIRRLTLDTVRVQLAGPPEDFLEYDIELDPAVLRDVVIEADAKMIELIESGAAKVIAMVHLSNRDKVQAIKQKPVAYYEALMNDWTRGEQVKRVSDSVTPVTIGLKITRRAVPEDLPE